MPLDSPLNIAGDLKSFEYEKVFGFHANLLLEELATKDLEMAEDIRRILDHALKSRRTYDIKTEDGNVNWSKYEQSYLQAHADENKLTKLSETIYKKYRADPARLRSLSAAYAKLANILVPNKLIARENAFNFARTDRDQQALAGKFGDDAALPGFIERILWPFAPSQNGGLTRDQRVFVFNTLDAAIDNINQVVFEPVLTAHPTSVNQLEALHILEEMNDAACELVLAGSVNGLHNLKKLKEAMQKWVATPLTPEDSRGLPRSFTPFEEIDQELDALEQIFDNMKETRHTFDAAFEQRAKYRKDIPDVYTSEKRLRLKFDIRFKSWVMGDKDGNSNIKAEHLLYSVVSRRLNLFKLYRRELENLGAAGITVPNGTGGSWIERLTSVEEELLHIKQELDAHKSGIDIPLKQSDFDRLNREALHVATRLGTPDNFAKCSENFITDLEQAYRTATPEGQDKLIVLIDKARSFGMHNGALELRETSELYTQILDSLITSNPFDKGASFSYSALPEDQKVAFLDKLSTEKPAYLSEQIRGFLEKIESTDKLRKYDGSAEVIAYHTLKRLTVASHHPDAVKDMILAEFKESSNILEALVLQQAVGKITGRNLDMPISPLFEEFDTLEGANEKIWSTLQTQTYRRHLLRQAGGDLSKIRLKVQIAHSDNVRRSGSPAARAGIYAIHQDLPEFLNEHYADIAETFRHDLKRTPSLAANSNPLALTVEWNEGRSNTDTSRGGGRAQTALVNAYGLHRHVKETYQNFDTLFLLKFPQAFKRLVTRLLTHCAKENAIQKRDNRPQSVQKFHRIEDATIQALKRTYADYGVHFNERVGALFAHPLFNADLGKELANRGSRNAGRGGDASPQTAYDPTQIQIVPTKPMRAIPYGNSLSDADMHVTMLATSNIEKYLSESFTPGSVALRELQFEARKLGYMSPLVETHPWHGHRLLPVGIQTLYRVSPAFRDNIDFIGNGLLNTFLERQQRRIKAGERSGIEPTLNTKAYTLIDLPREYASGAKLVLAAFGFGLPEAIQEKIQFQQAISADDCSRLHFLLGNLAFPHLQEEAGLNDKLSLPLKVVRDNVILDAWKSARRVTSAFTSDEWGILSNSTSGLLALRHGPVLAQTDPHAARYRNALRSRFQKRAVPPTLRHRPTGT